MMTPTTLSSLSLVEAQAVNKAKSATPKHRALIIEEWLMPITYN
jgi:hypothetical protein